MYKNIWGYILKIMKKYFKNIKIYRGIVLKNVFFEILICV